MKYDMAGGAGMLATLRAAAATGIRRNLVAVVPCVENMPSGTAYRPGDVLRMMSGKTVEILSTDAEGRLILADAMTYTVRKYRPKEMLDAATLTGACVVALGSVNIGMMGNDEGMLSRMKAASAASGEKAWELPLHEEYLEQIKSDIGELKNVGGAEAGAITAGRFLQEFAGGTPWVHFDIAGTAWVEKEKRGYPPGPSGAPVRLLVEYLSSRGGRPHSRTNYAPWGTVVMGKWTGAPLPYELRSLGYPHDGKVVGHPTPVRTALPGVPSRRKGGRAPHSRTKCAPWGTLIMEPWTGADGGAEGETP